MRRSTRLSLDAITRCLCPALSPSTHHVTGATRSAQRPFTAGMSAGSRAANASPKTAKEESPSRIMERASVFVERTSLLASILVGTCAMKAKSAKLAKHPAHRAALMACARSGAPNLALLVLNMSALQAAHMPNATCLVVLPATGCRAVDAVRRSSSVSTSARECVARLVLPRCPARYALRRTCCP